MATPANPAVLGGEARDQNFSKSFSALRYCLVTMRTFERTYLDAMLDAFWVNADPAALFDGFRSDTFLFIAVL